MMELLRLRELDQLTDEQALWFRTTKPAEELFDVLNDPHELNNLADNPAHREKLLELRKACSDWISNIDDTGMRPEIELIEELWPGFIQPETADPVISRTGSKIEIICNTEGASIGYKIIEHDGKSAENSWLVYTGPIDLSETSGLMAVAHRIGYKRSSEVSLINK